MNVLNDLYRVPGDCLDLALIVLGSGNLSFGLIRALVEQPPILICPRWVETETHAISSSGDANTTHRLPWIGTHLVDSRSAWVLFRGMLRAIAARATTSHRTVP